MILLLLFDVFLGSWPCTNLLTMWNFLSLQYWRQVYLVTVLAMILAVFFAQIHPHYLSKQWKQLRSLIFCSVVGYGLLPTAHWIFITGGFSSELVQVRQATLLMPACMFTVLGEIDLVLHLCSSRLSSHESW